ncbi:YadA C-terminal domain-containing protein [Haemophilus influenzae]|uniref:YadA C-terminal domain-containing protein n=1 Tax=Haemophilus influenzae TaxID=727 RepID=UPI000D475F70|nr:YadA C-terminal domain-containing protein [Haemophilus influenzae]PRJ84343.1 Adhesin YadA precursor [Haemophilus influenzae]PRK64110.1 Adhesin YadA precursor [Haemophilus influenzae]PRK69045.1 Adhesin YadA precursor [Haemophilus influenzae]
MKNNLLKQSVIAVLVGGAVSSYALAQQVDKAEFEKLKKQVSEEIDTAIDGILDDNIAYEAEVDAKLDQHSAALGRHTNRLNNLKMIAEKAKDDSSEALDKIKALEEQNDGAKAAVNLLAQSIGLNKTNIEKKADKTEVDANKVAIGTNKANIATNKANIATNTANIATNKTGIATNKANIATNTANIATNKTDIATNKAGIATNKAGIATNKADIATNKADITAQTAAIATHTQRLDNLDNRVNNLNKDLKRGLASQAALNGLFQPYNVGKLNLTAAVGGYKSQTTVAVGTGYRYNENIAAKTGVAFTRGGSATYNVGVNFEW